MYSLKVQLEYGLVNFNFHNSPAMSYAIIFNGAKYATYRDLADYIVGEFESVDDYLHQKGWDEGDLARDIQLEHSLVGDGKFFITNDEMILALIEKYSEESEKEAINDSRVDGEIEDYLLHENE